MGQTLSEPVVEKKSEEGQNEHIAFGVSSMQGWRISMEDAHACILDLKSESKGLDQKSSSPTQISFFGVYDGHGGDKVAIYTGDNLHKIVAKQDAFAEGDIEASLKNGFLATDRAILDDPKYEEEVSGCTASVGIITDSQIFCANAGDSRTVLGIKGRAKPLSFDHKPGNDSEKQRIVAAGGFVDFGRVNGNLALSRAIGDFEFKKSADLSPEKQIVTANPDITIHDLTEDDEFLVIACDGIWDCQSSQAVVEFVRRGIVAKQGLSAICENMMDNCLASNSDTGGVGCDNMTMTVIALLRGRTKEKWYEDIADRVSKGDGPCAPPEYAEFRGPGVHHPFDDSGDDLDMDLDRSGRTAPLGGRIILLGDGTELNSDSADSDLFDHEEEDRDLEQQVQRHPNSDPDEGDFGLEMRSRRDVTPGPNAFAQQASSNTSTSNHADHSDDHTNEESPSSSTQKPGLGDNENATNTASKKNDPDAMDTSDDTPAEPATNESQTSPSNINAAVEKEERNTADPAAAALDANATKPESSG